jgi:tetratricopeptide (TPR) repeat protein
MIESNARLWEKARRHLSEGRIVAARISFESLLQKEPGDLRCLLALSTIAHSEGRVRDAVALVSQVSRGVIADPAFACDVAQTLLRFGETVAARACLDRPELRNAQDSAVLVRLAALRKMLGEHPVAMALLDRVAAAGAGSSDFRFQLALELIFNGRMPEAEAELNAALQLTPSFGRAALARTRLRKQTLERNHIADLTARRALVRPESDDQAALEFALYKELEDTGRFDEAWPSLFRANSILFARQRHSPALAERLFDHLVARCTPAVLKPEPVVHTGPQPIFIIGMPRSGTTLLDRVLGNHSAVTSAGELDDFGLQLRWIANQRVTLDEHLLDRLGGLDFAELGRRYLAQTQWRANGASYFVDKLPRNWMVAGIIRRALPQARILNLVRDPMDVCFSNYRALLGEAFPWSYDMGALAAHYLQYRKVMSHWHAAMPGAILDVEYAELTRKPEETAARVLQFCGLAWEPGCADVTSNKSAVATLSMSQVREPIHTRFFNEWMNYEQQLQPLRSAIGA